MSSQKCCSTILTGIISFKRHSNYSSHLIPSLVFLRLHVSIQSGFSSWFDLILHHMHFDFTSVLLEQQQSYRPSHKHNVFQRNVRVIVSVASMHKAQEDVNFLWHGKWNDVFNFKRWKVIIFRFWYGFAWSEWLIFYAIFINKLGNPKWSMVLPPNGTTS